jgi:hypothetical protein
MEDSVGNGGRRDWFAAINVCGAIAGALLFGTALTGILVEAGQLWREGAALFFSDAGMRLFVGASGDSEYSGFQLSRAERS